MKSPPAIFALSMQTIRIRSPNPKAPNFSGSLNANNQGYSGNGRVTFGTPNRNVYVQGQVNGGWSGRPSVGATVGGMIRF